MKTIPILAAALLAASAHAGVLEVKVQGLNCSLCSEQMRDSLRTAAQASDIEPKLECGVIFLQTEQSAEQAEATLRWPLMSNGFNLTSVEHSSRSMDAARELKC
ncbi:hypothetical protein D3C71_24120 [compost metagenome]